MWILQNVDNNPPQGLGRAPMENSTPKSPLLTRKPVIPGSRAGSPTPTLITKLPTLHYNLLIAITFRKSEPKGIYQNILLILIPFHRSTETCPKISSGHNRISEFENANTPYTDHVYSDQNILVVLCIEILWNRGTSKTAMLRNR